MKRDFIPDMERIMFHFSCAVNIVGAIQTATAEGHDSAANYSDALYGVLEYMGRLLTEMDDCIAGERTARYSAVEKVVAING